MDDSRLALLARKTYAPFDGNHDPGGLSRLCLDLVESQIESWPEFRQGHETLKDVKVRDIRCEGFSVRLQHNPGRMRSTVAKVGEKDISARPCFLCPASLPVEQKGVLYRREYLILCNPMPVFSSHFTVSHVDHRPQAVEENIHAFLQLTGDLGEPWTVLYNGPRCGASAPDHLHFQVIPSGLMPIEGEIGKEGKAVPVGEKDGILLGRTKDTGREAAILEGKEPHAVAGAFVSFVQALKATLHEDREPMMSVAGLRSGEDFRLIIFPRSKHRPDAFFREGSARIMVSPAVIEMGGVFVTPLENDFRRLDRPAVEGIFKEVSLDGNTVETALLSLM